MAQAPTVPRRRAGNYGCMLSTAVIIALMGWVALALVAFETCGVSSLAEPRSALASLSERAWKSVQARRAEDTSAGAVSVETAARLVQLVLADAGQVKFDEKLKLSEEFAELVAELSKLVINDADESDRIAYLLSRLRTAGQSGRERDNAPAPRSPSMRGGRSPTSLSLSERKESASEPEGGLAPQIDSAKSATDPVKNVYTQQTCYTASDESELCVFDGPLCFDGTGPVVLVPHPIRDKNYTDDYTTQCVDPRYYEPSGQEDGGCALANAGKRSSYDSSAPIEPSTGYAMSMKKRRWGPLGRNGLLFFKELTPQEVAGSAADDMLGMLQGGGGGSSIASDRGLPGDVRVVRVGPFDHEQAPGMRLIGRTVTAGGITVDWLDTPLWLAGLDGQWDRNPFHWWSKIGALYDARRANATVEWGAHPADGYIQNVPGARVAGFKSILRQPDPALHKETGLPFSTANRARYRIGPQWGPLPAMQTVVFAGDGARPIAGEDKLGSWFRSVLELATPPGTVRTFGTFLQSLSPTRLVCSARGGAIPGSKAKWFSGRGDAWMWRQYAYQATGLSAAGVLPHPRYPPRKITFVDRKSVIGRSVYNREDILSQLRATGLPVETVENLGGMSFAEQVALMAGTGILIAPHGAALANSMFMPAHSVVIEMFPYLMKKPTYRHLATMADLHYFPLYSWELLSPDHTEYYGVKLMNEEYFWNKCAAVNISSIDALSEHACNAASKNYPIVVRPDQLGTILRDAVDIIGAYSLANPAWKEEAEQLGITPPPKPEHVTETVHGAGKKQ